MWNPETFHALMRHCTTEGVEIHEALDDILLHYFHDGSTTRLTYSVDSTAPLSIPQNDFNSSINQLSEASINFDTIETKESAIDLDGLVRAQAPRNFPSKVILRVLANLSQDGIPPTLEAFCNNAIHYGRIIREHFRNHETDPNLRGLYGFNQKLSSGFPKVEMEMPESKTPSKKRNIAMKSEQRFSSVYVANVRKSDGHGSGVLFETGLIQIDSEYPHHVHLTEDGLNFALLSNPILDQGAKKGGPLSESEIGFLVNHYRDNMPTEWQFLTELSEILSESVGMSHIRPRLMSIYRNEWVDRNGNPLSENRLRSRVDSISGSALNRLEEMGLLDKKRVTRIVQSGNPTAPLSFVVSNTSSDRVNYKLNEQGCSVLLTTEG
jgi:hypothetical protein